MDKKSRLVDWNDDTFLEQLRAGYADEYIKKVTKRTRINAFDGTTTGGAISPSLSAKIELDPSKADYGIVTFMDMFQHEQDAINLVKQGIIPLYKGYIFVDQEAFAALQANKTGTGPRLAAQADFALLEKGLGTRVSVPKDLFVDELTDTRRERDEDLFLNPKNWLLSNYHIVGKTVPGSPLPNLEQAENLLASFWGSMSEAVINKKAGLVSVKKPGVVFVYFTPDGVSFEPKENSILYAFVYTSPADWKNQIHQQGVESYTSATLEKGVVATLSGVQAAGHFQAFKTSTTEDVLERILKLSKSHKKILKTMQKNTNAYRDFEEESDKLTLLARVLTADLRKLRKIDKVFGNPASYFDNNFDIYLNNIIAGAARVGKQVIFAVSDGKKINPITGDAILESIYTIRGISTFETALLNSGAKAAATRRVIQKIDSAWQRAGDLYLKKVAGIRITRLMVERTSDALLEAALIASVAKVFNADFSKKINLTKKSKKEYFKVLDRYRVKSKPTFRNFKKRTRAVLKTKRIKYRKRLHTSSRQRTQRTQNIVPLINAEIKRYVINEMGRPSIENRSGRFAGSVRVLSAQENAAVQYTYQKSPYQVFSPSKGRRPWATEERDPAKIIDRAIKRIGQDKFAKVFRTEER
jgi:hypothetical protein